VVSAARVKALNSCSVKNRKFVLYWMQSSQRATNNLALDYAILKANELDKPLVVCFGLAKTFPSANVRHFRFLLEGLREVEASLQAAGARLVVLDKSPELAAVELSKDACFVVVDRGYLRLLRQWYQFAAQQLDCPLVQVEDNVIVPVEATSNKEEYSAATLRPKIHKQLPQFLTAPNPPALKRSSVDMKLDSFNLTDPNRTLDATNLDKTVRSAVFTGGATEAENHLTLFVKTKLAQYAELKNDPTVNGLSDLSPYLHFGQISPIQITQQVWAADVSEVAKAVFLEELIVRRELAVNYVYYNPCYDSFEGLPNWAKTTLTAHQPDPRAYLHTLEELENAQTHDPYWNASQNQMRLTGKMHGYMRMYWGKKILEWTKTPQEAFKTALYLNNKYELDGRDPNGYAGVAWCFGKHDRPWKERPVFGTVRFMNANGLKRKFDADKYVAQIKNL
jgi:deoxyribodipyrimidine photo-lyase